MKRLVSVVISALLVSALNSAAVSAQAVSTSQITGTVKDQTGAVLPGVFLNRRSEPGLSRRCAWLQYSRHRCSVTKKFGTLSENRGGRERGPNALRLQT